MQKTRFSQKKMGDKCSLTLLPLRIPWKDIDLLSLHSHFRRLTIVWPTSVTSSYG